MIKAKKFINLIFFLALMGTAPVFAQAQPNMAPQQQKIDVSDAELSKFADIYQKMRMMNQKAQQKMIQVVQEEGMDVKRFNEVHLALTQGKKDVNVTDEEKETHKVVMDKLEGMQAGFQKQMEDIITGQGLSVERYQQLAMALRSDSELQQRLQKLLQG